MEVFVNSSTENQITACTNSSTILITILLALKFAWTWWNFIFLSPGRLGNRWNHKRSSFTRGTGRSWCTRKNRGLLLIEPSIYTVSIMVFLFWDEFDVEQRKLGKWRYKSKSHDAFYEGIMFPLNVTEELVRWPEMDVRERRWVSVEEAKEGCQHLWMREALERLVRRLGHKSDST